MQANVARNYHHPTLNDMYWQPGGNPDLSPEEGYSRVKHQCYWETQLRLRSAPSATRAYRVLFAQINNWILWLPGFKGYWEPVNVAEVRSYGLEYQLGEG